MSLLMVRLPSRKDKHSREIHLYMLDKLVLFKLDYEQRR